MRIDDYVSFETPALPCRRCGDRTFHRLHGDPRCVHCIAEWAKGTPEQMIADGVTVFRRPIRLMAKDLVRFRTAMKKREKEKEQQQ